MGLIKVHHLATFVSIFIAISFMSCCCYGSTYVDGGYDPQAYPSYLSTDIDHREHDKDMFRLRARFLSLHSFAKVGDTKSSSAAKTFSVSDYGAKGDGSSDDTQAFEKAWKAACAAKGGAVLEVPKGKTYLLKPISFEGPCKSSITFQISGTVKASDDRSDYKEDSSHWIKFDSVQSLVVQGGGTIDGNGKIWWQNSCKVNKKLSCKNAPTAVTFYKCKNLTVKNIKIQNAQQIHVSFEKCSSVVASSLTVKAPGNSPNTDGIHITGTQNIQITSSVIGTGDDCISIVNGSQKVQASDITCGPGHGISIGSLGEGNSEAYVSGVTVNGAKLSGTTNGVRIKTWQGGSGSASNIVFKNIEMDNVSNPIIIDQNYCDQDDPCEEQSSAVQVKNVLYQNIKGTSASSEAISFGCSKSYPCKGIVLQQIDLESVGDKSVSASCTNVKYTEKGSVSPSCSSD